MVSKIPAISGLSLYFKPLGELAEYLNAVARERGPTVCFRSPLRNVYLLTEPAMIEAVFVTQARAFHKGRGVERLRSLLGNGLLTAEQPEHLRNRRLVQPAFHRERIAHYARIMVDCTQRRLETWRSAEPIAIDDEAMHVTLDIVARALFGSDVSADAHEIGDALDQVMTTFPARMSPIGALLEKLPVPSTRRFIGGRARLDAVVRRLIDARRRSPREDEGDVLSLLIGARDENGTPMSDAQIRDEVMTLLLAGHETTANAIAWTFYLLGRNEEARARLVAEADAVLGERRAAWDDVARLSYARAVVTEAMRIYPPAWTVGRRAICDVVIGDCRIARGELVLTSPYVTHRDPALYADPERFEPARWLGESTLPKFAYFPFGGGNRTCIGESFAWTELTLAVATIAQRVRLEPLDGREVRAHPFVTLRPARSIMMRPFPRARVGAPVAPETNAPQTGTRAV